MTEFSSQISEGQSAIKYIESKIDQLIKVKPEVENSIGKEQDQEILKKINKIISDVQTKQASMKGIIDSLDNMIKISKENDNEKKDTEIRIRENLFYSMTKKYQDTCIKFQNIESDIKNIMQTKNIRSAEIVLGKKLTDEEKLEVINDPNYVQQLYGDKLTGGAHVKLQNAVSDLKERHKDIIKLEESILQLHKLINELSALVDLEGEMIDHIASNIEIANNYINKGVTNLGKAKDCLKKARRKKCCILIIAIVILLVVLIPIISTFT